MEYNIAICDDSAADRAYLGALAERWAAGRGDLARLRFFNSAESFLFECPEGQEAQILLLDIEMGAMDGVTMAKRLRRQNDTVQIVFITGYGDYIAEGYEVAALHYLMKPVKADKLFSVLDRAAEKLAKDERALALEARDGLVRVPVYQIKYAEVQGNYVTVHAREDVTVKMPLGDLERQLDDRFFRVGRSFVVNLTLVSRVTRGEILLRDGSAIPLPRGAYDRVNRAIINMR